MIMRAAILLLAVAEVQCFGAQHAHDISCIQTFMKVKSASCGYATLVQAIFNEQYDSVSCLRSDLTKPADGLVLPK